jgi:serine/threonine-protein kinase
VSAGPRPSPEFLALQAAVTGRYVLDREIGRGGMGAVFLARDVALERPVAIKLLLPHLAGDASLRERFLREARTAAQLTHPNIVPIHAVEDHGAIVFFVMSLVDGETLAERVGRRGVLSAADAVRVMRDIAFALGYAHGRGVIHRDVKPENVLLEHGSGRALLTDFGIARLQAVNTLSDAGAFVGTVQYMSPEQASAEPVDGRSDIYSLGATMYFSLTGVSPVEAATIPAMLSRLITEPAPSVLTSRPDLPPSVVEVVSRASARRVSERYETADALAAELHVLDRGASAIRPEVRGFIREVLGAQPFTIAGLLLAGGTALVSIGSPLDPSLRIVLLGTGAALSLALPLSATASLLQLRRQSISLREAANGLRDEARDIDALVRRGQAPSVLRQASRSLGYALLALGGLIGTFLATLVFKRGGHIVGEWPFWVISAATSLYVGSGIALLRGSQSLNAFSRWMLGATRTRQHGAGSYLLRGLAWIIDTRICRRLFGEPERKLPPATAPAQPSATLLRGRVEDLLRDLPQDLRLRLPDVVPAAIALERAGTALRARLERLDRAMAELSSSDPAHGEFSVARARLAERLADCITALETIRTDLLRLSVGLGAPDGLTIALERATELSAAIDAELHGQDRVRKLLG